MGISFRLLMASVIALVAIITGTVCFAPTYATGVNSVVSAVDNVRSNLVTMASERVTTFFGKPRDLALTMQFVSKRGRLDSGNATAMVQLVCDIAIENMYSLSAVTLMMLGDNIYRCDTTRVLRYGYPPVVYTFNNGQIEGYNVDPITHTPVGSRVFNATFPSGVPLWAADSLTTTFAVNPSLQVAWTSADILWNSTQLEVGSRLTDPSGNWRGAVLCVVSSYFINRFLLTLGLRENGRAIVWDESSGGALALSWNEWPVSLYPTWQDQTLPVSARAKLRQLDNFTDPTLNRVLVALGGMAALRALPVPFSTSIDRGKNLVYVDIAGVRDAYGLNVKILMMMPQIDFLRDIYRQQTRTLAGVCSGVAVMIILAFFIGHYMAAPLRRLADRMQLTASFQDEEADDPPSVLSEVASMQVSYSAMKSQLNVAKTYLPQSVMAKDVDEDDEEEGPLVVADASEGKKSSSLRRSETATSRSSRRRTNASSGRGAGAGGLNLELGLALRNVTIVAFNLQGFMRTAVASARRCAELQEIMLTLVQRVVRDNKGVVDYFQGDRVLASFNAVTNTVAHGRRGLVAAVTAVRELKAQPAMPLATVGISSGMALCGNMGTADMRRFCVVGHPVVQALALERMTKMYRGIAVLMPGWLEADAQLDLYHQALDVVALPGGGAKLDRTANRPTCLLLAPMALKSVVSDEWMYELKQGEDANPFRQVNIGFKALVAGDLEGAKQALSRRQVAEVDALAAANLADHIQRAEAAGGVVKATDFGSYYEHLLSTASH